MHVIVENDYQGMSRAAARFVARQVLLKPDSVLGLPTGTTPLGMYTELVRMCELGVLDFSRVVTFNLDEFYRIPPTHPGSYHRYMHEKFFDRVNIAPDNVHLLDGAATDPAAEARRYADELAHCGGVDLQILGIGPNGHIGFNEPGTDWGMTVVRVKLSAATRRREARRFGGMENVPTHALTMGIKSIMRARKILLLAAGTEKAVPVQRALSGPISADLPATVLQLHPDVTVVLDRAAAASLASFDLN